MPILDRMNGNNEPDDAGHPRRPRQDDKGREPKLFSNQIGSRLVSQAALLEKIEAEFTAEHSENKTTLVEADTSTKRLRLVLETVNYVLAVESVHLSDEEKADLVRQTVNNLFGYGALDPYFADEQVTTITLEGADKAHIRYGHGDLVSVGPVFLDERQMHRMVERLLRDARAEMRADQPYLEAGLTVDGRRVCVNLLMPPITFALTVDIRVHPAQALMLDDLVKSDFLTPQAADMVKALVASPYGFVVAGDTEAGKTTFMSALTRLLPEPEKTVVIERAGEMDAPDTMRRLCAVWSFGETPGITFGEQIAPALALRPTVLMLDEVRSDEPMTVAPLLQAENPPRQIWSFRGSVDTKRLRSGLGMLARRSDMAKADESARALFERLPFVVTLYRANGKIGLFSIGEWQNDSNGEPTLVPLMQTEAGELRLSGNHPSRALGLPDNFWT